MTAVAGVTFANILVFVQLGILGALNGSSVAPYSLFNADILISSSDANTLSDGGNIARQRMFQALGVSGVNDASGIYIAMIEWQMEDGASSTLQVFGINPDADEFINSGISKELIQSLRIADTALIDASTRGASPSLFKDMSIDNPLLIELNGTTITATGELNVGSGFTSDGSLMVSDQTFLRLFANRRASAPSHVLIKVDDGLSKKVIVSRLRKQLDTDSVKVNTIDDAIAADLAYQTTERPTGVIFGFGVLIGVLVGIVIVYQVLATDVANHLREYATFKAMGYKQSFFSSIVFEEAIILAVIGFLPGLVIASLLYAGLASATGLPISMDVGRAVGVLLGTIAACGISGAIATRRLAGADPADLF
jgi:putative ABC transport system permease protein